MRSAAVRELVSCPHRRKTAGYTLIEMAVVISVVGLLAASFISAYHIYTKTKTQIKTENNASAAMKQLSSYLIQKGRYPCPARMDLPRTDPQYGMESECDPLVTVPLNPGDPIYPAAWTAGTCGTGVDSGLCFETGDAANPVDMIPSTTNVSPLGFAVPRVRRGMLPFRAMGLPEDQAVDGFGSRFHYAVTENLAVATTFVRKSGGIIIVDGQTPTPNELTPVDNRAHYALFSSGADRGNAYSYFGKQLRPCPAGTVDEENCDTAADSLAKYVAADFAPADGAAHFDDYIKFYTSVEIPLWKVADTSGFHIRDLVDAEAGGKIGIGLMNPQSTVDVAGEVRANEGNVLAAEVCDLDGSKCIPVSDFGSESDKFKCPAGTYGRAFGDQMNGKYIKCVANIEPGCPTGKMMVGVLANGEPDCRAIVTCPEQGDTLCSSTAAVQSYTIPSKVEGTLWSSPVVGVSRQRNYECNNGSWQTTSTTGLCTCTAVDEYISTACNAWQGYGNWTGTITRHHTITCPDGVEDNQYTGTCVCEPTSQTQTVSCPSGLTGNRIRQRDWICTAPDSGYWTAWTIVQDNCGCNPATQTQSLSCGTGYTGSIEQHRDRQCPAGTWGSWITDSNTCTCTGATQNRTIGCTSPLTGTIQQHRDFNCGTNSWGSWITDADNCTCDNPTQTRTKSCTGQNEAGEITEQRTYNCATSNWGPWTQVSTTCTCQPVTENRVVGCTSPLVGSKTEQRQWNCATTSWGPWQVVIDNCGAVAYSWVSKTAATGPFGGPLSVQQGASCTNPGATSACSSPAGGGQYWHYTQCQCE